MKHLGLSICIFSSQNLLIGENLLFQKERSIAKHNVNRYDKQINFLKCFLFPLYNLYIYFKKTNKKKTPRNKQQTHKKMSVSHLNTFFFLKISVV